MLYKYFLKSLLFSLDAEKAHNSVLQLLKWGQALPWVQKLLKTQWNFADPVLETELLGQKFRNPVGLAAGFDKNCEVLAILSCLGFGFIEGGTITAQAQPGNPKPRIFRLPEHEALINRLGFNNKGAQAIAESLSKQTKLSIPLGLNIGKSKETSLEQAIPDYLYSFEKLYAYSTYMTVNVSSPNTPGLRQLQKDLAPLLAALQEKNKALAEKNGTGLKPLFVKVAPDLEWPDLDAIAECCIHHKVTGIIASNTTIDRKAVPFAKEIEGGLSGPPLQEKAMAILQHLYKNFGKKLIFIGVGGIASAPEAYARIKAGASLIQLYTGLIYKGPSLIYQINQGLAALLKKDGFKHVQEAVGTFV
jgi:dihydroorotate dehydrogenase